MCLKWDFFGIEWNCATICKQLQIRIISENIFSLILMVYRHRKLGSPEMNFVDNWYADLFSVNGKVETQRTYRTVPLGDLFQFLKRIFRQTFFSFLLFIAKDSISQFQKICKGTMYGLAKHSAFSFCERLSLYNFNSLMALFIPQATDVLLFLTAESTDESHPCRKRELPYP